MPGLGSQVSLCDMPPHKKIWMTDLVWTFLALALALAASSWAAFSAAAFSSAAFCSGVFVAGAAKARELKPPAAIRPAVPKAPRRMASRRDTRPCCLDSGSWT